jgi:hypothetical protein
MTNKSFFQVRRLRMPARLPPDASVVETWLSGAGQNNSRTAGKVRPTICTASLIAAVLILALSSFVL